MQQQQREQEELMQREQFLTRFGKNIVNIKQFSQNSVVLISLENQTKLSDLIQLGKKVLPHHQEISIVQGFIIKLKSTRNQESIYCIDMGWINSQWTQQKNKKDEEGLKKRETEIAAYAEKIQYLHYFLHKVSKAQMSVYLCMQYTKRYEQNFKEQCAMLGRQNFGVIYLQSKKTTFDDKRKIFISEISDVTDQIQIKNLMITTSSLEALLQMGFLNQDKKQIVISAIKKIKSELETHLIELLEVPKRILLAIIQSKNKSISNISDMIKTELVFKNAQDQMIQESIFRNSYHQSSVIMNKISSNKMKQLYFLQEFIELHRAYVRTPDLERDGKQFIIRVFENMRNLGNDFQNEIDSIIFEVTELTEHTKRLEKLSQSSQNNFFSKNIIGKCKDWAPGVYKLLKIVSRMQILENQSQRYYEELQKITALTFQEKDFPTKQLYQQIKTSIDSMKIQVKIFKNYLVMLSNRKQNLPRICKAIKESLSIYQDLQNQRQSPKLICEASLLKNTADSLRNINQTRLAMEIYQKLKFFMKIEECVMEIMMECTEEEKIKLLVEVSVYFKKVNELELSKKYAQMIYEMDPKQVNLLVQTKLYCLLTNRSEGLQFKILKQFKPENPQTYTSTPFSSKFLNQIQHLQKNASISENYSVKIKKHVFENLMKTLKK